jgi:hypothetical protein
MIPHFIDVSFRTTNLNITVDSSGGLEVSIGKLRGRFLSTQAPATVKESANHQVVAVDYLIIGGIPQQRADFCGLLSTDSLDIR